MAEKLTRKEKIALQKKAEIISPKKNVNSESKNRSLARSLGLLVALAGFLLFSNSLSNDYVLDDFGLIKDNTQTKKGISAIPEIFKSSYRYGMNITDYQLYRPLTKAMFAIEWDMAPNNPALSHWLNVLFFSLLCYVLFRVLNSYMNNSLLVPFIASLLFASHPLHSEVVANIKGRDEIISFLFCLLALWSLRFFVTKDSKRAFIIGIACYFIALFAKESAITFLVIIPLFYYFFTDAKKEKYFKTLVATGFCTILFLLIRRKVLGDTIALIPMEDNSLVAIKNIFLQKANAIYLLGVYLKLLVLPFPLISDGSYNHFPPVGFTSWKFLIPLIIFLIAGIFAIISFKKKSIISFSILYFFITVSIVSNVIILIGTNYGERLMFVPSLGFCILIAVLISKILTASSINKTFTNLNSFFSENIKPIAVVMVIVILFGIQTTARNAEWKDNLTLYTTDTKKTPDSAHMLFYLANHITSDEYLKALPDSSSKNSSRLEAIQYLTQSIKIFPKYADGYQRRGYIYKTLGKTQEAENDYKAALECNPTHPIVYNNYGTLCFDERRYQEALNYFLQAVRYNPRYAHALNNTASVYGVYGLGETEMITKDPANKDQHIRSARENFENAIIYFKKAIDADSEFAEPYRLLAITYRNIGDTANGDRYDSLYKQVSAKSNAQN